MIYFMTMITIIDNKKRIVKDKVVIYVGDLDVNDKDVIDVITVITVIRISLVSEIYVYTI